MRARGAKVTDIAVLVVAADDGVMPQTRESISHARAPRCRSSSPSTRSTSRTRTSTGSSPTSPPRACRPEEWGGTTQFSGVSAKQRENLDDLLERILLVADAELELKANPNAEASGPIIESRLDVGRGPVATMLVQRGTLRVGDAVVAGDAWGKVRALYDYNGERVKRSRARRPGRDRRLRQDSARGRAGPRRRERAPGARARAAARRAPAPGAARPARRRASRSRRSSRRCRKAASRTSTSCSRATSAGRSRPPCPSSPRSSTPRSA